MKYAEAYEVLRKQSICEKCKDCENECETCAYNVSDDEFIDALDIAVSVLKKTEDWSPVTERQPEENGFYSVTKCCSGKKSIVRSEYYSTDFGWDDWGCKVSAWRPLPAPYKDDKDKTEEKL